MKIVTLVLGLMAFTSLQAFECTQNEAQFIGNVTELHITNLGNGLRDCTYKISFTHYNESKVCPLDLESAKETEFLDYLCASKLTNGDEVSGILIEKNGYIRIE